MVSRIVLVGVAGLGAVAVMGLGRPNLKAQSAAAPAAVSAPGSSDLAPRPVKHNVVDYHKRDEKMRAAKDRARATLPRFIELMDARTAGVYTVKFPLTQNGKTEHIWLQVDSHRNGAFDGRLANKPVHGDGYRMGQRMTVPRADVEDWSVVQSDAIYGGYTSRVVMADMPQERTGFRKRFLD